MSHEQQPSPDSSPHVRLTAQADRDAVETELSGRLQEACDSATQWKEAAERVASEKGDAEAAHAQVAAQLAALQASSAAQLVRSATARTGR